MNNMTIEEQLKTLKDTIGRHKEMKARYTAELKLAKEEGQRIKQQLKELGIEPNNLDKEIALREQAVQEALNEAATYVKAIQNIESSYT